MAPIVPCGSLPKKMRGISCGSSHATYRSSTGTAAIKRSAWIVAVCALSCAWFQAPVALAQHGAGGHAGVGGHVGGGHVAAPHVAVPPRARAPISRPSVRFGPRAGFGQRPIFIGHRVFLRPPFFRGFYPAWWLNCGPTWVWEFGCGDWLLPEYGIGPYVPPPAPIYEYPVYEYYGGQRDLVQLFLKDATVYSVTDYWFVDDKVHFTALEDEGTKSVEQVISLDELDLQKTIEVNTRRGFRLVRRDEPIEQYLRDHPDANPPLLETPPKS